MQDGLKAEDRTRRPRSQFRPLRRVAPKQVLATGVLVLLVGPQARGKDVLIAAARNRYNGNASFDFPTRLATRVSSLDREHIAISRREFHKIETGRGFAVAWDHFGARHGLTAGSLHALDAGHMVVLAAAEDAVADFTNLGCRVEVVVLKSSVDVARPVKSATDAGGTGASVRRHQITHTSDIAHAVRQFLSVLDTIARSRAAA
jgi:hypothetical protein